MIDPLPPALSTHDIVHQPKVLKKVRQGAGLTWARRLGSWIVLTAALAACGQRAEEIKKAQSLTRRLAEIAGQANQAAPAAVDPDTRLDGARAGPGLKLTTMYTLVNPEANGVNSATFEAKLAPIIKQGSCENPELRPLIDQGVAVVLEYRDLQGNPIGTINVNRDACGALPSRPTPSE